MLLFAGIALLNGMVSILNKMVNLQAKLALGTANGTLINYLEATAISFLIVLLTGSGRLTDFSYLRSVPPVTFLGGLFGLISMVLILNGMAKAQISYSTVVVLIGQLGTGFVIDSIAMGKIAPVKVAGILLVVAGVVLDKHLSATPEKPSSVENPQGG
jgi:Uncharacterized protein conserved in bacteria